YSLVCPMSITDVISLLLTCILFLFFFQAEDGIRDATVTGVQTCALPIWPATARENCAARGGEGRATWSTLAAVAGSRGSARRAPATRTGGAAPSPPHTPRTRGARERPRSLPDAPPPGRADGAAPPGCRS